MRDILKKVTTGAMIAGAALFVAACGGDDAVNNAATTDMGNDSAVDMNAEMPIDMNDMNMTDNMGDMNASTDMNMSTDMNTTNAAE